MHRIIIVIMFICLHAINATADITEIEAIEKIVGESAMIVQVPGCCMRYDECRRIYVVRKHDNSIWTYYINVDAKGGMIIKETPIFERPEDEDIIIEDETEEEKESAINEDLKSSPLF